MYSVAFHACSGEVKQLLKGNMVHCGTYRERGAGYNATAIADATKSVSVMDSCF